MRKYFFISFLALTAAGCKVNKGIDQTDTIKFSSADSTALLLKEGQEYILASSAMRIAFKGVIEDSRCPKGVQCVWAGVGTVELEVTDKGGQVFLDTLATSDIARMGYKQQSSFGIHRIKLEALNPYPISGKSATDQGGHTVVLSITNK